MVEWRRRSSSSSRTSATPLRSPGRAVNSSASRSPSASCRARTSSPRRRRSERRTMSNPVGALGSITQGIFGGPNQNQAAPTIDTSGTNAWQGNPGNVAGNEAAQQQAIAMAQRTAAGQGPSAATSLLNEQTKQAQAQAGAMAASGQGSTGQALARRDAMMAGANATQELGGQAATARAQEQLGGEQLAGSLASGARGQDLTAAGQQAGLAQSQGQLQEQQNQTNTQSATSNATSAGNTLTSMAGMAAGALMFADGDARGTPPGGAR